ncbi:beta-N-acetylhexosaminidase [Jannaschia sp. LMIT008]|uniref:beta-N-acetylhexosaminidase n=1 Tax=Jannaschia maritima TaxID=3032585 RepID=UPI0028120457|nr:beta-N-acetylhexosaminidase [Jannaschia sp. LMIT008]
MTARLHLSQRHVAGPGNGGFTFRLRNLGDRPVTVVRLCYASMTRLADDVAVTGGRVHRKLANHVEVALDPVPTLPPGQGVDVALHGLTHPPLNRSQGAMAAWVVDADGVALSATVGDLQPPDDRPRGPVKPWPAGRAAALGLLPWPARVAVDGLGPAPVLSPAADADPVPFAAVAALHRRLFPTAPAPFDLGEGGLPVRLVAGDGAPGSYSLDFDDVITVRHRDADGLRHGVITLAQMAHAARGDGGYRFPSRGRIEDAPTHGWRGCHLDVARNMRSAGEVLRLLDVMAWHKLNRFHWHLSDDEGYRLPSRAFPALADIGARRGGDAPLPPQYADGPEGQAGTYSQLEVAAVVAHAAALGIEVVPEIDLPGHTTAILSAIPDLADSDEPADSYRSIQGYPNNALNPGLPRTYEVVEALLDEVFALFPGAVIHVGGDEVDANAWHASPAAAALGIEGAMALQSHFLRRVQAMVRARGRTMAGWDECARGGGVFPEGAILMAWQTRELTAELIAQGYDVVATPGQAYYLDMVQGAGWDAPGTSWAGPVPVERTYAYEPTAGLPDGPGRLLGVQACLWSEHLSDMDRLRDMAHPRLSAVAEAAWTPPGAKDFSRFAAHARLMPLP